MCGLRRPMWPRVPATVAAPMSRSASRRSRGGRVMPGVCVIFSLPVGDRAVGAAQVRGFPELERLCADARLVDLDAEAGAIRHAVDGTLEPRLHREELGVVEAVVE